MRTVGLTSFWRLRGDGEGGRCGLVDMVVLLGCSQLDDDGWCEPYAAFMLRLVGRGSGDRVGILWLNLIVFSVGVLDKLAGECMTFCYESDVVGTRFHGLKR